MTATYNRKEAAKALGVSVGTIDKSREDGRLPYRDIGKRIVYTDADLNALLDNCAVPAAGVTVSPGLTLPRLFDKEAAAKVLCISLPTLDRLRVAKKMPYRKIRDLVFFTEGDLAAFVESCGVPATCLPSGGEKKRMAKRAGEVGNESAA